MVAIECAGIVNNPAAILIILFVVSLLVGGGSIWGWLKLRGQGVEQVTVFPGGLVHSWSKGGATTAVPWNEARVEYSEHRQDKAGVWNTASLLKVHHGDSVLMTREIEANTAEADDLRRLHRSAVEHGAAA